MKNIENISMDLLISALKVVGPSVFIKNENGEYIYMSHSRINNEGVEVNDSNFSYGLKDINMKRKRKNILKAEEQDKILLETGVPVSYDISETYDGLVKYLRIDKKLIIIDNKKYIVGTINDVSKEKKNEQSLKELAYRDDLTGCMNRNFMNNWYKKYRDSEIYPLTVIMVDCNDLKKVNDSLGHDAGDQYIINSINCLKYGLPKDSHIIRVGGDEFVVLIPNFTTTECEKYVSMVKNACDKINVSLALGYAIASNGYEKISSIIKKADENMYIDKNNYKKSMKQ